MQEFNAKLSDFGLAKTGPTGDQSHVITAVMGTEGYADPEYIRTGDRSSSFLFGNAFSFLTYQTVLLDAREIERKV